MPLPRSPMDMRFVGGSRPRFDLRRMRRAWSAPLTLLNLSALDSSSRQVLFERQAALTSQCGCTTGSLCALAALVAYFVTPHIARSLWLSAVGAAGWAFTAALTGKVLALLALRVYLLGLAYFACRRRVCGGSSA
jgi:hypothetical protein